MFIILLLLAGSLNAFSSSPVVSWNRSLGGNFVAEDLHVDQTTDGGYIMTGQDKSGCTGRPFLLVKADENGTLQWIDGYEDGYGLATRGTKDGGDIAVGYLGGFGDHTTRIYYEKTYANGSEQWNRTYVFGTDSIYQSARDVLLADDGGYLIAGTAARAFLMKTDEAGNVSWAKTYGLHDNSTGGVMDVRSISRAADGGYLMAGECYLPWNYQSICLLKTDRDGNYLWDRAIKVGDGRYDFADAIVPDADGSFVIAVRTMPNFTIDQHTGVFLLKVDANGQVIWKATIDEGDNDEVFVAPAGKGGFLAVVNDGDPGTRNKFGDLLNRVDMVEVDDHGSIISRHTLIDNGYRAMSLKATADGGYILAGRSQIIMGSPAPSGDFILMKLDPVSACPAPPTDCSSSLSICPGLFLLPLLATGCLVIRRRRKA